MKKIISLFITKIFSSFCIFNKSIKDLFINKYGDNKYVKGIILCITILKGTYLYKIFKFIIRMIAWINILLGIGILTMYVDVGTFHLAYVNIYHDLFINIYNYYQHIMKWIINQLFNHIDNLEGINLEKIDDIKMIKIKKELNNLTEYEYYRSTIENADISDNSSKVLYMIIGTTIIVVVMCVGYIYIDEIKNLGISLSTNFTDYGSYIQENCKKYFFGSSDGIDPRDMTPKAPEPSLPESNPIQDPNNSIHVDDYFENVDK